MRSDESQRITLEIQNPLQKPNSLTLQQPGQLPDELSWVGDLLAYLRMATKRLHPEIVVVELKKKYQVKFFHYLPFNEKEKKWLKNIVKEYAELQGETAISIYLNSQWLWFETARK